MGIDVVDDGEMGKSSWITYLYERTSGIEPRMVETEGGRVYPPSRDRLAFPEFYVEHDRQQAEEAFEAMVTILPDAPGDGDGAPLTRRYIVTGPLVYDSSALQRDITNFKHALDGVDVVDAFLPVVAPASAYWLDNEHYATDEEFVFALADVLHEEYKAIVDAGFLLQVDDAVLVHEYDSILSLGGSLEDYRRWAELRVEATNHALSRDPRRACPLSRLPRQLARAPCLRSAARRRDRPRAQGQRALLPDRAGQPAPRARVAALGGRRAARTTRCSSRASSPITPDVVEHPELVADRLVRLASLVGRERVMGGTDCGFAQGAFLRRVHPTIQWAKLEALAEGARLATKQLSGAAATA